MKKSNLTIEDFFALKFKNIWTQTKQEHYSFWMICGYLFFEFVRPQSIFTQIAFIPWGQVMILGAAVGAFTDPTVKIISAKPNKWMILFLISVTISILSAFNSTVAKSHFMDFFSWFLIYFLITSIVNTQERIYIFILIFILASAKIAIGTSKAWAFRGFSFASWGLSGPAGYFQNSGELAILMLTLFPLVYYMHINSPFKVRPWEKYLLLAFWVCPILTILGASSRGAQIALALQLMVMFRKSLFKFKSLAGMTILAISIANLLPKEQIDRFTDAGADKTSQQRLLYWKHGMDMIMEYPLTGVGFFNFIPYYETHYPGDMLYPHAELPHNIFIQVGTDAGMPAMLYLGMLILYCFTTSYRITKNTTYPIVWRNVAAGLGIGVLGFAVAGQFVTVTYYPFLWIHLSMLAALANILKSTTLKDAHSK